jgi:peptide/nickel transport system permease protein
MSARSLAWFLLRRLAGLVAVLIVVSLGVYTLLDLAPGSPEDVLLGNNPPTPAAIHAVRSEYNLDDQFFVRYGKWVGKAVQLDFGRSVQSNEDVYDGIVRRLGLTLPLAGYAFLIAMLFGVPLGVLAAMKRRGPIDRTVVGLTVTGFSSPAFVTGIFLLYLFGRVLGWFPIFGRGSGFFDELWHLTLPAVALALAVTAIVMRLTRAATIDALGQDYVVFARARGLSRRRVLLRYVLRNSLIPVVTAGGLILSSLLVGGVLVEVTFALPGLGQLLAGSVANKDITIVQGVAVVVAVAIVAINFVIDVLYLLIDPRIRFSRSLA